MKVSTHLAKARLDEKPPSSHSIVWNIRTNNSLLKFATVVKVEQFPSAQCKNHALMVFLEVVVDLGGDQSGKFAFGEIFIFIKRLSENSMLV